MNPRDHEEKLLATAVQLLNIDRPSGFTHQAIDFVRQMAGDLGYYTKKTNKGGIVIHVPGREEGKKIGVCAHIDTLGLMCRSITKDGMLMVTPVGGPILPTLDGEYCHVFTRDGGIFTGTMLSLSPASHVHADASTRVRDAKNMALRLDELVTSDEDVKNLGISPGDYICIDPKAVVTPSGFLKSRFLDDKASVAALLTLLHILSTEDARPRYATQIHLTVYEEVGHGGATIPNDLDELLAVDMGCIGEDLTCKETQVSICAKDSAGPFDYEMVSRLIRLAKEGGIDYAVDIYPAYSSDVAVAWRAGSDARAALIGPGVHASHGMERTHKEGLFHTMSLIWAYLECES